MCEVWICTLSHSTFTNKGCVCLANSKADRSSATSRPGLQFWETKQLFSRQHCLGRVGCTEDLWTTGTLPSCLEVASSSIPYLFSEALVPSDALKLHFDFQYFKALPPHLPLSKPVDNVAYCLKWGETSERPLILKAPNCLLKFPLSCHYTSNDMLKNISARSISIFQDALIWVLIRVSVCCDMHFFLICFPIFILTMLRQIICSFSFWQNILTLVLSLWRVIF